MILHPDQLVWSVDIISVYLKVVMHQGFVLSPLFFGVVMHIVHIEARSGIPSELLYANDLVLMVMVGSSDGNIIVNLESDPVGKQCSQALLNAHYVNGGLTSSIVVYVVTRRW